MNLDFIQIADEIIQGRPLELDEAREILKVTGWQMTAMLAGAQKIREHYLGPDIELCSIINAKSGRCGEDCAFCAQSSHHNTQAPVYPLKSREDILAGAIKATEEGSHCYGIVTSGTRAEPGAEFNQILASISDIRKKTPIEPSASLGILDELSARALAEAGCVTYHHNLETARSFFPHICTTHSYEEDVVTVLLAKASGMKVCCGGIFGLGETGEQRIEFAQTLCELDVDSVPLNFLNPIEGTPLENQDDLSALECLKTIALFRYMLPRKRISVCGGRDKNLRDLQSWIFAAGASGTMIGNYLTTTGRDRDADLQMFRDLEVGINACK